MARSGAAAVWLRWSFVAFLAAIASAAHAQSPALPSLQNLVDGVQRVVNGPALNNAETLPAPPKPAENKFLAPLAAPAGRPVVVEDQNGLISLSVRDASLRQVLAALAETQGFNIVIAAPAETPVTAEFKRLPLHEVFATLMRSTGHTWTEHEGVIVVTSVTTGGALAPEIQGRRVAVIELDFASAADLQPVVDGLLSTVGQSFFVETNPADNRRTKELLIVEDLEPYLQRIERYVAEADQPPRQVLIEVNLLQVTLEDDQRCGVNFESLGRISGTPLTLSTQGFAGMLPGTSAGGGLSTGSSLSGSTWSAASPGFFIQSSGGDMDALIEALISTTDAKSLANPRLLAVNGQESRIQVGQEIGYTTTTTVVNGTTSGQVEYLEVGTILSVTPRITRDGRILMRIAPEVSSGAIDPDTKAPNKETTELQTSVLLHSGQGMVIGGLIQEADATRISRVPVLGSLPYINPFFQRRIVEKKRSELIVALVPHVLPLSPELECRNQEELMRARDPLVTGPLCRNPRPYEPRLPDPHEDLKGYRPFAFGRQAAAQPVEECTAAVCEPPVPAEGPRRLPTIIEPIEPVIEPEVAEPLLKQPEIATRPGGFLFR